jgi:hypothetical protein
MITYDGLPGTAASLPDSFFEPAGADVKAAQTTLASRTQALTNAPLMTQSMREMNEKQRRDRWPQVSGTSVRCARLIPSVDQYSNQISRSNATGEVFLFTRRYQERSCFLEISP